MGHSNVVTKALVLQLRSKYENIPSRSNRVALLVAEARLTWRQDKETEQTQSTQETVEE